ncbi:MAG: hypothetical protein QOD06_208 [Candidatus Binatota bacterium]|nr:hypothetical protein [Candidatus Binatota bacterium]
MRRPHLLLVPPLLAAVIAAAEEPVLIVPPSAAPAAESEGDRTESIRRYQQLLASSSAELSTPRDEITFRLAVLLLEEAQAAPGGGAANRQQIERATALLEETLRQPASPYREDALYFRALALEESGRHDEAIEEFRAFVRELPASGHAAELWFRLGNDAVQRNQPADAVPAYEEVLRRADPRYHDQAAYLLGWSAFAAHQDARARTTLVELLESLERGRRQSESLYSQSIELLAKIVRAEGDLSVYAGPRIRGSGGSGGQPEFVGRALRRTADLFAETSAYADAARAYEQLLRDFPDRDDAADVEARALDAYRKAGDETAAETARERLIQRRVAAAAIDPAASGEVGPLLRDSAIHHHERARQQKTADAYRVAIDAYQKYADSQPVGAGKNEAEFFQAEALKEMGDAAGAAERYRIVAEIRDAAHGEDAAFRRVALLEELSRAGGSSIDDVIAACRDYSRLFPGGPRETELGVRQATIFYERQRWAEALAAGNAVIDRIASGGGRAALELMLARAALASGDAARASASASRAAAEPEAPKETRTAADEVIASARTKLADALAAERPADAAALYREVVESQPGAVAARDAALAGAGIYRRLGDAGSAITLYEKFLGTSPPDDLRAVRVRAELARALLDAGRDADAERFAREAGARAPVGLSGEEIGRLEGALAEARLVLADVALRRFDAVQLVEPVERALDAKRRALDEALTRLREAATYGFADVSLASYYKIGYAQLRFAEALLEAPRPRNLNHEEQDRYDTLLREQASPYRLEAEKAFRLTLERAHAAGVENEWTALARGALGRFAAAGPAS